MTAKNENIKAVSWTITGATILLGKGAEAKETQPIFTIHGTIVRSDSTSDDSQKGNKFDWTPALKAKGYALDLSKFDKAKGTGTIIVNGTIGKGGRKEKAALEGKALNEALSLI